MLVVSVCIEVYLKYIRSIYEVYIYAGRVPCTRWDRLENIPNFGCLRGQARHGWAAQFTQSHVLVVRVICLCVLLCLDPYDRGISPDGCVDCRSIVALAIVRATATRQMSPIFRCSNPDSIKHFLPFLHHHHLIPTREPPP